MKKIKVAEIITRMDWAGSPDIVRLIVSRLDPEIYDVKLIIGKTRFATAKTKAFLDRASSKITVIPELKRDILPVSDLAAFIRLFILFRAQKFDIVHTHTAKAGALGRLAAYLCGVPVILHTPHGHNFYGYFNRICSKIIIIIEKFLTLFTDKIICLTDLERQDFLKFKVADEKKLTLIYQGLELDEFTDINIDKGKSRAALGVKSDALVVGFIGRLERIKGLDYLIEASVSVLKNNPLAVFLIVGEGSLHKKLEKKVNSLGLASAYIFSGWRDNIPDLFSAIDLLVLPSLNEAVGIVLVQAQAMGIPVVATKVGGIPEIIKDNQTGILVPPRNPQKLARAMSSLLKNKDMRLQMS
ncbi:MAG: glycosyltransferase family 4 protein, partial [Candidatus Omnitrophica bacterium]|nr:glycosyltransferase family 4 protein [Candidatus Omnitrophota bacterium]